MFIDSRKIDEGAVIDTTVCIIGGGVAGIMLALEMEQAGIPTVLLESGGHKPDDATRDLYRGESVGIPYIFADGCRSRFLGGSSNCWGGWCRPWESHDFEQRDWVPHSGWPFGKEELDPYYEPAIKVLKITQNRWDAEYWEREIGKADVKRLPWTGRDVVDIASQFSPPARMGKHYRNELAHARHVRTYLYANVMDIETDNPARTVQRVKIKTLTGRNATVVAKQFILATGGIENARLLLASNRIQPAGLGNGNDLVGRYYMDHPRLMFGRIHPRDPKYRNKMYDHKFHYQNAAVSAHGQCFAAHFTFTPEALKRERMLNAQGWFASIFPGEDSDASWALIHIKHAMKGMEQPDVSIWQDIKALLSHPGDAFGFAIARLLQPPSLVKYQRLHVIVEPSPNPDSRVTLSRTEKDALGMPRVRVDWRMGDLEKHSFDRAVALISDELRQQGLFDVEMNDVPLMQRGWPDDVEGTWHHMGATRMHDSPKQGVVDRNCLTHGMTNLYIAGSSVFPTVAANFPTLTIAAMTLRLADHLKAKLRRPEATLENNRSREAVAA